MGHPGLVFWRKMYVVSVGKNIRVILITVESLRSVFAKESPDKIICSIWFHSPALGYSVSGII